MQGPGSDLGHVGRRDVVGLDFLEDVGVDLYLAVGAIGLAAGMDAEEGELTEGETEAEREVEREATAVLHEHAIGPGRPAGIGLGDAEKRFGLGAAFFTAGAFASAARAFATDAAAFTTQFVSVGLPATFITQLNTDIAGYETAISTKGAGLTAQGGATGGIEDRIDSTLPPVRRPKIVPRSYSRLNST